MGWSNTGSSARRQKAAVVVRDRLVAMEILARYSTGAVLRLSFSLALTGVIVFFLILSCSPLHASAQSFDDAIAAYQRKDYKKALSIFEELGAQGHVEAQQNAGHMYVNGLGTPRNYAKAMAWYRRAAEQGYAVSQYDLGLMYEKGEGVSPDPETALMWFRKSAEQGFARAQTKLAEFAFASGNMAEAFFWWKKAADSGDADAMFNVGSAYSVGRGVDKDLTKAIEYYRKARDAGNDAAEHILKQLGADCMRVGDIQSLEGVLAERKFQSAGGKPLRTIVLALQSPACMRGDDEMDNSDDVREIQLSAPNRALERKMERLLGKRVFVRGKASPTYTMWFYSRILINVTEIEPR
jgi:TPR repeat protein